MGWVSGKNIAKNIQLGMLVAMNESAFTQAQQVIPGGVNSPVRAFGRVGGEPPFIQSAKGAYVFDQSGRRYIDYVGSWGPMILGHADPDVIEAVQQAAQNGLSFGAPTIAETELATLITQLVPSIEQVRLVNSGTEAAMSAIRLARGFTGRDAIIKFKGCYHGHADCLLVDAGSGAMSHQQPTSDGVTAGCIQDTLVADFNNLNSVEDLFKSHAGRIAAIIVEPVAGNMNCVPPIEGFLEGLRAMCDAHGALLIFDEVMTGFRVAKGGAQSHYHITPDLTVLGKIMGGGMPMAAFGGRRDIMAKLSPTGGVYQAGTLSGNPIAVAAGLATLKKITAPGFYEMLIQKNEQLQNAVTALATQYHMPFISQWLGGMFGWFFTQEKTIEHEAQVAACDFETFKRFFHHMLDLGIYLAPSPFEAGFISIAHSEDDIKQTASAFEQTMQRMQNH